MAERKKKKAEETEESPEVTEEPVVEAADEHVADEAGEEPAAEEPEAEPAVEVAAEGDAAPVEEVAEESPAEEPAPEPVGDAAAADDEPAAEAEEAPAVEAEAGEPAAEPEAALPAPQSGPKPKKKRLPRSERPARTKKKVAKTAARKPIVRLEKPEHERGRRQERQGTVVSNAMDKTIVVKVDTLKAHRKYEKVVRRSNTFHAHDEANQANVGDVVRIVETRPLSKTKRWRLAEIVEAAK